MAIGRINGVATLTGFLIRKCNHGHLARTKKGECNNEETVLMR